jgi:hypothetical protein
MVRADVLLHLSEKCPAFCKQAVIINLTTMLCKLKIRRCIIQFASHQINHLFRMVTLVASLYPYQKWES